MFLALEGTDGAGKSTLADAVVAEIESRFPDEKVERFHCSQLKRDPLDEYCFDVEDYAPGTGRHIVADRWHWGETIYAPLYRGATQLTPEKFRWAELFLASRGMVTFLVTAPMETIVRRLQRRGEDYLQPRDVERVWTEFHAVSDVSAVAGDVLDTGNESPETLARHAVRQAVFAENMAATTFTPQYIGRTLPHSLLVGDVRGGKPPHPTEAPFMPRGTSSGKFLFEALPSDLWWRGVGVVNAAETDVENLPDRFPSAGIVALGRNASDALKDHGVEHGAVPHPQYVRRFHAGKREEYGRLIRETARDGKVTLSWPK